MINYKQYVKDYVEGRVNTNEFVEYIHQDPKLLKWLQSVYPKEQKSNIEMFGKMGGSDTQKKTPYDICSTYNLIVSMQRPKLIKDNELHSFMCRTYKKCFPTEDFQADDTLQKKSMFLLEACPEYLSSIEIENAGILEDIMEELPESMGKTKREKAFREKLKSMFYVEGQKYPRWIQASEWPLSKTGKPTKFLRQKNKGEITYYYFLDVDTYEEIEIMQAY